MERRFLSETGMPVGRWLRHAGMINALKQLATGTSVKVAAAHAGYRTPSAFIEAFRATFGTTPGQFFATGHTRSSLDDPA
jgi:AraC-like DNA-binding protein